MKQSIQEFLKYGIGGGVAFLLSSASLFFFVEKLHFFYLVSAIISYGIGFLFNFTFQAWITFKTKTCRVFKRLGLFLMIQVFGFALFTLFIFFFTEIMTLHYYLSFIISAIIVFIFNYLLSKNLAFK